MVMKVEAVAIWYTAYVGFIIQLPHIQFSIQHNMVWKIVLILICKGLKPGFPIDFSYYRKSSNNSPGAYLPTKIFWGLIYQQRYFGWGLFEQGAYLNGGLLI